MSITSVDMILTETTVEAGHAFAKKRPSMRPLAFRSVSAWIVDAWIALGQHRFGQRPFASKTLTSPLLTSRYFKNAQRLNDLLTQYLAGLVFIRAIKSGQDAYLKWCSLAVRRSWLRVESGSSQRAMPASTKRAFIHLLNQAMWQSQ